MSLHSFSCPFCQTVLKTAQPLPAGQTVRCPKCGEAFGSPAREMSTEVMSRPPAPPLLAADADETTECLSDRDDRPRLRKSPTRTVAVAAVLFFLLASGAAFFAWHKIRNAGVNHGTGNEDPLAFLPADSALVIHLDMDALLRLPEIGPQIERQMQLASGGDFFAVCKKETGLEFQELIIAYHGKTLADFEQKKHPPATVVIHSRVPFNQAKIARSNPGAVAHQWTGKTYYQIHDPSFKTLFMPSDRIMVLTNAAPAEVERLVASDGRQPMLSADATRTATELRHNPFWMLVPLEGPLKRELQLGMAVAAAQMPPELRGVLKVLPTARAASLWARLDGDHVHFQVGLTCADDDDAQRLVKEVQGYWDGNLKGLAGLKVRGMLALLPAPAGAKSLLKEFLDNTVFDHQGPLARSSTKLNLKSLQTLIKDAQQHNAR